jgi:hypothetical protein
VTLPSASVYASVPVTTGQKPGIIFSGAFSPNFGINSTTASQTYNWKVGGSSSTTREVFTDTHSLIPTSYRFLLETASSSGLTPAVITDVNSSLIHGIYQINGNTTLSGAGITFGAGNYIILINGDLTIKERITVPTGSTVIFSSSGNITIDKSIGEASISSTTPTIEGIYSADNKFVADGNKNCPTSDLRLNIAGSVIANAGRTGGTFVNNRTLCNNNSFYPSVSFIERPDFMLSFPSLVRQTTRAWQDVAP